MPSGEWRLIHLGEWHLIPLVSTFSLTATDLSSHWPVARLCFQSHMSVSVCCSGSSFECLDLQGAPEIKGWLYTPILWKMISSTKKSLGWGNAFGPSAIRCNAQIYSRPEGQGWSEQTGSLPRRTQMRFFCGKWPLSEKILQYDHTDSRFVFKFQWNWLQGSGWNDVLYWWQKVCKIQFFCDHFGPVWLVSL